MKPNPSNTEAAVAVALAHLLTEHPELRALTWTVDEGAGVLIGRQTADSGSGELIDACAAVLGGTVARSVLGGGHGDRQGLAQFVAVYDGVPVDVAGSYPVAGPDGLTSTALRELLTRRPLGTVAVLPGGAQ